MDPRRQQIIEAAAELFEEKGYHATSMQDLADAMGFTKAALYYYVSSKEEVLREIFDRALTTAESHLQQALQEAGETEPHRRVERVLYRHILSVLDEKPIMAVFFNELKHLPPSLRGEVTARRKAYEERIMEVFREAAEKGFLREVPLVPTVYGFLGMSNWLHRWYRLEGPLSPDDVARLYTSLMLNGILAAPDFP